MSATPATSARGATRVRPLDLTRASTGWWIVAALTFAALALRLPLLGQSIFGDELSTWYVTTNHGFGGVIETVHSDAEISPPLYFVLAWLLTRIQESAELLRFPALVAGVAAIPLTYLLGRRTFGAATGVLGAALAALSPFMIYYSVEARGYSLAISLVLASTLSLLAAVDSGRLRWWAAYAGFSSAAVYTHYTVVFALAAQLLWLLWAHPEARRSALLANVAALVAFLPWVTGVLADFASPTTDIVDTLDVLTLDWLKVTVEHWTVGYPIAIPNTPLRALPGVAGLVAFGLALVVAAAGIVAGRRWQGFRLRRDDRRLLIAALAVGAPVGVVLVSAVGVNVISVRHLATSWPAFAVGLAGVLLAAGPRFRPVAAALALACFGIGAAKMFEPRFHRADYDEAAAFVESRAGPRDVVLDGTVLSPAPMTAMDVALEPGVRVLYLGRAKVRFEPFAVLAGPPPPERVALRAVRLARGGAILVVSSETVLALDPSASNPFTEAADRSLRLAGYRPAERRVFDGSLRIAVTRYRPGSAAG